MPLGRCRLWAHSGNTALSASPEPPAESHTNHSAPAVPIAMRSRILRANPTPSWLVASVGVPSNAPEQGGSPRQEGCPASHPRRGAPLAYIRATSNTTHKAVQNDY
jgi:hypothetical protein